MSKRRWIFGVTAAIIAAIFAVFPQVNLQKLRGTEFQGAFASSDLDEMAYASYLQSLIDGRPRKNDPYTGRDDSATDPQPESLFSIQFVPAYLAAVPARVCGLSASQTMPLIAILSAFFTALALFWLIVSMTGDGFAAAAAALAVIAGGALIVGIGAVNGFYEYGAAYPFFPFLRRYIPSVAFPFMFAFFAFLWKGLASERAAPRAAYSICAALSFAALVFSYFYVWTAAGAVLAGLILFSLILSPKNRRADLTFLLTTAAGCAAALIPFALMLAGRDETMDKAQLLVLTRQPDFLRGIEVGGFVILAAAALALWRKFVVPGDRIVLFIAAFAFAPVIVFNQQILTGRSLQPFHYEFYVVNYIIAVAAVLSVAMFARKIIADKNTSRILTGVIGLAAIFWGGYEAYTTTVFWDSTNVRRDEAMLVNRRLRDLAGGDIETAKRETTLNLESLQADGQPTVAPQPVLWARHQHVFAGLRDWEENKKRYYLLLYYSDLDAADLRRALRGCSDIEACMALFGWDRFNARLSANARPLTAPEVEEEVRRYDAYIKNFSRSDAESAPIHYLIVYTELDDKLTNFSRWFDLDAGEVLGKYTLYRTRLKPSGS